MATATLEQPQAQSRIKVIDADTHLTEPHDMWTRRASARFRDRVPQVRMLNGQRCWVIDGDQSIGTGAHPNSSILKQGGKVRDLDTFLKLQFEDVHTGSSNVKDRIAVMDAAGIHAQIVYPNILGFGGQASARVDPELRLECVRIYNDAMAELQEESGQRLFPMALLPWWDVAEAVKETERCAAMGLRGININSDPHTTRGDDGNMIPDLGTEHWFPLYELCNDRDIPINFHIGASETSIDWMGQQGWPSLPRDLRSGISGAMLFFNNGKVVSNLIYSGILDRFRNLKFVSVESGIGWVPFLMEALDYQLAEIAETKGFEKQPSEYFKSNFYACFWFEKNDVSDMLHKVGVDNCLFETDFPHPTSLYPIDNLEERLSSLTQEDRAKVLSRNAARLYRIAI
ncbi:amidohydrolase family protein [Novosphingobium album (ex Liu et al. 2023)]|uniref:Amidohydrolase family protein n=1 Tax=Novosphingobium album (ex Liu et al. 2023) TaxID=3031130 RepID=A0ABT5WVV0_9SPHN|nr:amidohydrolase family protein [Novosphingobium album (ex Liu et al. 2023)]MDE8653993.1 amidohydrolase family protein [Novosphingobium album (ex Liu et al. 2023)]